MKIVELEEIINNAFEDLQNISEKSDANIINAIRETIELTDKGELRVAVKENGKWKIRASHWSPVKGGSGTTATTLD